MASMASYLRCLCGAVKEDASILQSHNLPIETEICHCNLCRHSSGALCPTFTNLSRAPTSLEACTIYRRKGGRVDQYFCTTCGSRTFDHAPSTGNWYACTGIIEPDKSTGNVVKVVVHNFVLDTKDGGLAPLLRHIGGRDIPSYAERDDQPQITDLQLSAMSKQSSNQKESRLLASCHCGSNQFYILPPQSGLSDLQTPQVARWLRSNDTKYLALNCACNYCRRAVGFPFATNTYVMPENIVNEAGQPVFDYTSMDQRMPDLVASAESLKRNFPCLSFDFSSPGIRRSFCSKCGASVFFERETRPQCVNVAVGILRASEGVLARRWIDFDWEVSWKEFAVDQELVEALEINRDRQ